MNQIDEFRQQVSKLQAEIAAERGARLRDTARSALASKVRQPDQFVRVLEASGLLTESGGELQVKTTSGLRSLSEGVDYLLSEPGYSHFSLETRTTKETTEPEPDTLKYFDSSGNFRGSDSELMKAFEHDQNALSSDLARLLQQRRQSPGEARSSTIPQAAPQQREDPVQLQRSTSGIELPDDKALLKLLDDPQRAAELLQQVSRSLAG